MIGLKIFDFIYTQRLGNLPVERAKDAVCFLQWCGVSLVSSYAVCVLQRGGVSLASSAIIYNIVKVKVTCWPVDPFDPLTHRPVDPFDPLTHRPVDLFEKEALKAIARSTYINRWDVTRLTRWPVEPLTHRPIDLLEKEPLKGNCEVHVHTLLRCSTCSKRRRIRLCCLPTAKQKVPLQRVAWGWRIYNIVEGESDPLTPRPVDLFEKEPLKGKWEVNLHTPTKFGEDPSKDLGVHREQTNAYSNYSMILKVNLFAFAYRLFNRDFSPIDGTFCIGTHSFFQLYM